jgi:hypothetical protein
MFVRTLNENGLQDFRGHKRLVPVLVAVRVWRTWIDPPNRALSIRTSITGSCAIGRTARKILHQGGGRFWGFGVRKPHRSYCRRSGRGLSAEWLECAGVGPSIAVVGFSEATDPWSDRPSSAILIPVDCRA